MLRLLLLLPICLLPLTAFSQSDTLTAVLSEYFKHYQAPNYCPTGVCKLTDCSVDEENKTIDINTNDVFGAQPFTDKIVKSIYASISRSLPENYKGYKLNVYSEGRSLSELIPNPYREKTDKSRLWNALDYKGEPWVFNASKPYIFKYGLQNRHLSVWASHGRYYSNTEDAWKWQRPYLFSTTEDLLTQTFVVPFLIPMLENSGAIVFSPRERSWQSEEIIVDNDAPAANGSYLEKQQGSPWQQSPLPGFANTKTVYFDDDNPFSAGSARMTAAASSKAKASYVKWMPKIRKSGMYEVYVSYQTLDGAVDDAEYTVYHGGVATRMKVNQRMGGGTWVYLGRFFFSAGENDKNCVVLSNVSGNHGVVSADAVRFGGGMGNVSRSEAENGEPVISHLPRFLEGARYSAQWYGVPYSYYSSYGGEDDYKDDINARSYATNWLSGGSVYMQNADGRKVPIELSLAVHSDAGYKNNALVGTLGIATTNGVAGETSYPSGISRKTSLDFAYMLTDGVTTELSRIYKTNWPRRESYDKNYSESSRPAMPSAIIETLSHQNFRDMIYAHDPWFKFNMSRSIYKAILRYMAFGHGGKYVVSPLAPDNFSVEFTGKSEVTLKWNAVRDSLEPTAVPTGYIVYTRVGNGDFDNGEFVSKPAFVKKLNAGIVYSFRVTAVNKGGESFPTETLSACRAKTPARPLLVVNCFDRLSGPEVIEKDDSIGFDLYKDIGVPYMQTPEYSGAQKRFDPNRGGDESAGGLGFSGYELASTMIAGNTFDYAFVHGSAIAPGYSFVSCSRKSVENGSVNLSKYPMVDVILGLQKRTKYSFKDYKTLNGQMRSKLASYLSGGGSLLVSGAYVGSDMPSSRERSFLAQTLHCVHGGALREKTSIAGAEEKFSIEQEFGHETYAVQSVDRIKPANGSQSIFKYSDGSSAGVLYQGANYRCATLGFPLESIKDKKVLANIMLKLVKTLAKDNQ